MGGRSSLEAGCEHYASGVPLLLARDLGAGPGLSNAFALGSVFASLLAHLRRPAPPPAVRPPLLQTASRAWTSW